MRILLLAAVTLSALAAISCGGGGDESIAFPSVSIIRSATPTPTAKKSPSPTPTPLVSATPFATVSATPSPEPTPPPTAAPTQPSTPAPPAAIVESDNILTYNGIQNPNIPATAGQITFQVQNAGVAIHNIHVTDADGIFDEAFCAPADGIDLGCTDPARLRQGVTGTLSVNFPMPGTYLFRCDYHPSEMTGTFVVQ